MSYRPDFYDETSKYLIRRSTFREDFWKKIFFSKNLSFGVWIVVSLFFGYLSKGLGLGGDEVFRLVGLDWLCTRFLQATYI